jgi:hypothetical protein
MYIPIAPIRWADLPQIIEGREFDDVALIPVFTYDTENSSLGLLTSIYWKAGVVTEGGGSSQKTFCGYGSMRPNHDDHYYASKEKLEAYSTSGQFIDMCFHNGSSGS